MVNINFVPDDYVQNTESRRTNLMCLVLFLVVMAALGGSFATIQIRQRACVAQEQLVNARMTKACEAIKQFEELQKRRKDMMKTALTTAELLEPVPRSILLASLTNNLPPGVSLLKLDMVQKEPKNTSTTVVRSKFATAQAGANGQPQPVMSREKLLETHIDMTGTAPSDLEVASFIKRLSNSTLLSDVALIESKERKVDDTSFRQFKLKALLTRGLHLTSDDVDEIRKGGERSIYRF
jgi:hypothetical protein